MAEDKHLVAVAKFLRNPSAVPVQEAIMADKRVDTFKGSQATKALLSEKYKKAKGCPPAESKEAVHRLLQDLLDAGLVLRARTVGPGSSKVMQPDLSRSWSDDASYVWIYKGSQLLTMLGAIGVLVLALLLVMYPLWPASLRRASWYLIVLAMGFIGLLLVISVFRLVLFGITFVTCKPGIWLFPNLYEDVSFVDSFIPLWGWHKSVTPNAGVAAAEAHED